MAIRVEGHTDSEGDDDYNMTLSQRRADSVRRFIAGEGIDESRLEAVGRGETRPLASNATPQGRRRNRRVEFHIGGR
jgi:outer membrane protein OmpA-like peptidoglycan-associated protein